MLSYYMPTYHDVLDKYEKGDGVINEDVANFKPEGKYGLIVSISTLEHVGWNETPKDSGKIPEAISNMLEMLEPVGQIVSTVPLG